MHQYYLKGCKYILYYYATLQLCPISIWAVPADFRRGLNTYHTNCLSELIGVMGIKYTIEYMKRIVGLLMHCQLQCLA